MFWTVKQAALFLGLDPSNVYYLLFMGEIEAVKIGKSWRIMPDSVRGYKEKRAA
jgi:excisionase family DNA binding protein